jgi:acetyl esterase/lipase
VPCERPGWSRKNRRVEGVAVSGDPFKSLDPELRGIVAGLADEFVTLDDIAEARVAAAKMMEAAKEQSPEVHRVDIEQRVVPGPPGAPDVAVRIYRPEGHEGMWPALLWIHGGGYVLGSVEYEDPTCSRFAAEVGCVTVGVQYRLAPEHPFPAPLEDCYAALKWMVGCADELGIDRARVAIGGASAGGGLAAGLALLARDRGEIEVVFQLLVYPMLDDCNMAPSSEDLPDTVFWTRANNLIAWRSYLGRRPGEEGISHYASACRATDLRGLPPAYIAVGDQDLFVGEDIGFARGLITAGVPTELRVYPGGCHGFDMLVPEADISRRFISDAVLALKKAVFQDR